MLQLRYSHTWRIGGIVLLMLVLAGTVLPVVSFWPQGAARALLHFDKWIHGFMFLFLALWYSGQYSRVAYWRIGLGLALFGAAIELIQRTLIYRSGDLADMGANLAGIAAGLTLGLAGFGGWSVRVERWIEARRAGDE